MTGYSGIASMDTNHATGRRDFTFPPVPDAIDHETLISLCHQFAADEFAALGMACEFTLYTDGDIEFGCTVREHGPDGPGEIVEEWGTIDFFVQVKQSFTDLVNAELEKLGQPPTYRML